MSSNPKVLLLDNHDSFTYNIAQILRECETIFDIRKNDEIELSEVEKYGKIIFSPGPGVPQEARIMSDILDKYAKSKSILGICLGHQAIAHYFGWKVVNLDQVYHGVSGKVKIVAADEKLFRNIPGEFDAGLYHSWAVEKTGTDYLEVTALSGDGIIMALKHKTYDLRGVQFHPESHITVYGKQILSNWLSS